MEQLEPRTMLSRALGIDVSNYQGTINWASVHSAGKTFAFAKATEGASFLDSTLANNMVNGTSAGVLMGAYHFARPDSSANDAVNEANWFLTNAGQYVTRGYLRPVLDVEDGSSLGASALSAWVNTWCTTVQNATGVDPIIYCNTDYATNYLNASVTSHNLWIANWSTSYGDPTTTGSPPAGVWGGNWDFWQYSDTGSVSGISGAVDLDAYTSDLNSLESNFQINASVVYQNGFENGAGPEWSKNFTNITPSGRHFLGQFGGGNNATTKGTTTWVTGRSGSALHLDGTTGWVDIDPDETLNFDTGAVTVSAWVKLDSTSGTPVIAENIPTSGGSGFLLGLSGGKLTMEVHDSSNHSYSIDTASGGTAIQTGTWYHLAGTFSNGTITTYVNGIKDRQTSVGLTSLGVGGTLVMGKRKGVTTRYLSGAIDDVQVFSRALSVSEIPTLPAAAGSNGLVAFYNFDENAGTRIHDTAGAAGVKLTLNALPTHTQLTISFDLYVIHSWDGRSTGAYGPDIWNLTANGTTLLNTTFANGNVSGQSYPGSYPSGNYPKQTGATEIDTLGYGSPSDSVYHLTYTVSQSSDTAVFNFTASDLQGIDDESWGLDNVTVSVPAVTDLSVQGVDEAHEETDGAYVPLNANGDEGNKAPDGTPRLDDEPDAIAGDRILATDPGLVDASVSLDGTPGNWQLTYPADKILVWRQDESGNWVKVSSGVDAGAVTAPQVVKLKIEGIAPSASVKDVELRLTLTPSGGGTPVEDVVNLTVSGVDLDIDSDNNNSYGLPGNTREEELLEDDATKPGKIVYVNDNDTDADGIIDNVDGYNRDQNANTSDDNVTPGERFVPVTFTVDQPFDPSGATFQVTYLGSDPRNDVGVDGPAGGLRLWAIDGSDPRNGVSRISDPSGDYIAPGQYSGSQLGLSTTNGQFTLWVEAAAMPADPHQEISISVDPDGPAGSSGFVLADAVWVTVEPSSSEGGTVTGFKWNDLNGNGIWDVAPLQGDPPDLVYVIDVSGSTIDPLTGFETLDDLNGGDVNSDGRAFTRLDAELAGFIRLTQYFSGDFGTHQPPPYWPYQTAPSVSIVLFGASAATVDMDQSTPQKDLSVPLTPSSVEAITSLLESVKIGGLPVENIDVGQSTNYVAGLTQAHSLVDQAQMPHAQANVIFLSDGFPNPDNWVDYERSAEDLRNAGIRVRAFGAGNDANIGPLNLVDYYTSGRIFHSRDELLDDFAGGAGDHIEPVLAGWTIYADLNGNDQLDVDEQTYSSVTDSEGRYSIIGLPAGTYSIREVIPAGSGWTQTAPQGGATSVTVAAGQVVSDVDFGNQFDGSVDLDVDSDNTGDPPDRSQAEETLEADASAEGKQIAINTDFDTFTATTGLHFAQTAVDLSAIGDLTNANITFAYNGSDPTLATTSAPAPGTLRIWLKDADQDRSSTGDYVISGHTYAASALGLSTANPIVTLYVEAIAIAPSDSDRLITLNVVPDSRTASRQSLSDSVYVRPYNAFGSISGRAFQQITYDDPVSRPPGPLDPVHLISLGTGLSANGGIDYYPPDNSVVISVNSGDGHNFDEVFADGTNRQFSDISGLTDEVKIATVRPGDTAGFLPGDFFVGTGTPGEIARVTDGGKTLIRPWVTLPGAGLLRGSLQIDRGSVFGGDLVVLTDNAQVWLIDPKGNFAKLATLPGGPQYWEGLVSVPNDSRWGPLAGTILAMGESGGDESGETTLYALSIPEDENGQSSIVDPPQVTVTAYQIAATGVEDMDVIPLNANFFGINYSSQDNVVGIPAADLAPMAGDILITEEYAPSGESGLVHMYWDANSQQIVTEPIALAAGSPSLGLWEHVAFGMAGIGPIHTTLEPLAGRQIFIDNNNNGTLDAGEQSTTTDANGDYSFIGLDPGEYRLAQVLPSSDWTQTAPAQPSYDINLGGAEQLTGVDFGSEEASAINHPPVITSTPPGTVILGQSLRYDFTATDIDGDSLTYSLPLHPDGMTIDTTNPDDPAIVWTAPTSPTQVCRVLLQVTDGHGGTAIQPFTVDYSLSGSMNLTASAASTTAVDLAWTAIPGVHWYYAYASADGKFPPHWQYRNGEAVTDDSSPPQYSTRMGGLSPDTSYHFLVRAVIPYGSADEAVVVDSNEVIVSTFPEVGTPARPAAVTAVAVDASTIHIDWKDNEDGVTASYNLYRGIGDNATFASASLIQSGRTPSDFTDTGLSSGTQYTYWVVAVTAGSALSAPSAAASAQTLDFSRPAAPTDLTAGYGGMGRVGLRWSESSTGLLGFDIYRGTKADFNLDASTLIGSSADPRYTDDVPVIGDQYWYAMKAVGVGSDGNEISSAASFPPVMVDTGINPSDPPSAPTGLQVSEETLSYITLDWNDNSIDELGFRIYRCPSGSGVWGSPIGAVTQDATTFTDDNIDPTVDYDYQVRAWNVAGEASSSTITVGHQAIGSTPNPVQNLREDSAQTNDSQVGLAWDAPTSLQGVSVAGYNVFRLDAITQAWVRLNDQLLAAGTLSYVDSALNPNATYTYRVVTISSDNGVSTPSDLPVATDPAPAQPPIVQITAPQPFGGFNVDWSGDLGARSDDGRLTKLTQVRATIKDLDGNTPSWSLVLHPINVTGAAQLQDISLASGTGVVESSSGGDEAIFTLDPSLYPTGEYSLELSASDVDGQAAPAQVDVSLYSDIKLGNLTLPYTDLQFDVPDGLPITVRRTYDSQNADKLGDCGYGWTLAASNSAISTTIRPPSSGNGYTGEGFRLGDLLYITLPGGVEHAFQFWPVPQNYEQSGAPSNPYDANAYAGTPGDAISASFIPQFVCVDGSNATLEVSGDIHDSGNYDYVAIDRETNEAIGVQSVLDGQAVAYNPADAGNPYTVRTADGTVYVIDSGNGKISSITGADGKSITYHSDNGDGITSGSYSLIVDRNGPGGTIREISLSDSAGHVIRSVQYTVDPATLNLISVLDTNDQLTQYQYGPTTTVPHPHHLTEVIDPRNLTILTAGYDDLGRLKSLANAAGNAVQLGPGGFDGQTGGDSLTDPQDNETEQVYDSHGNAIRTIRTIKDGTGAIVGYSVTVRDYQYNNHDLLADADSIFVPGSQSAQPGAAAQNEIESMREYRAFEVSGSDPTGLRYSQQAMSVARDVVYNHEDNPRPTDATFASIGLPSSETVYLDNGDSRVTTYTDYKLGKPQTVSVVIEHADGTTTPVSSASSVYDEGGHITYTFDSTGQGTEFDYYDPNDPSSPAGMPSGLVSMTYRVLDGSGGPTRIDGDDKPLNQNFYYTAANADPADPTFVAGASPWRLQYSIDAAGQRTYYSYDAAGDVVHSYRLWINPVTGQPNHWVGTTTIYDDGGRVTDTYDATYEDQNGDGLIATSIDNSDPTHPKVVIDEPVVKAPVRSGHTDYNSVGQVAATTDAYGDPSVAAETTRSHYDDQGHLVETLYPDGTETQSVYDSLGRVILAVDRFTPGQADPVQATRTIYDSLGRVIETQRVSGVSVTVGLVSGTTEVYRVTGVAGAGLLVDDSSNPDNGVWKLDPAFDTSSPGFVSHTRTFYDEQGRVIETIDAAGLRTGTIYYDDGRVHYTGVLKDYDDEFGDEVPDGGRAPEGEFIQSISYELTDLATYTTYTYDLTDQLPLGAISYDAVTDALNHTTKTYKDALGRVIQTTYDDGTFTQTLYGVGNSSVDGHDPNSSDPLIAMPGQVIVGHQETKIDQRGIATDYFYDLAGRLTDVWQPAVNDADPASPTYNKRVRPHWTYVYDSAGNEVVQVNPKEQAAFQAWIAGGTHSAASFTGGTSFTFDDQGRQLSRKLPLGQAEWSFYDDTALGDVPAGSLASSTAAGELAFSVDFEGRITRYEYDNTATGGGRVVEKDFFASSGLTIGSATTTAELQTALATATPDQTISYSYDGLARLQQVTDSLNGTWTYSYDPISGQVSKVVSPQGTVHHEYDPATGRLTRTYTGADDPDHTSIAGDGKAITDTRYTYDLQGRLLTVSIYERNDTPLPVGSPETTTYFYDGVGNLDATIQSNGITTDYQYDDLNRLKELDDFVDLNDNQALDPGETLLEKFIYGLNPDGTRSSSTEQDDQGNTTTYHWLYDNLGRLKGEAYDAPVGTSNDYVSSYGFDVSGNRVSQRTDHATTNLNEFLSDGDMIPDEIITGTFDANDRLNNQVDDNLSDDSQDRNTVFSYGGTGDPGTEETDETVRTGTTVNSGTKVSEKGYTYDVQGRMSGAVVTSYQADGTTIQSQSTSTYKYDPDGMRIEQVINDGSTTTTTNYVIDKNNPTGLPQTIEEKDGSGNITKTYTIGLDVLTQYDSINGALTLLYDGHGSTRALTNSARQILQRFAYDAYGNLLAGVNLTTTNALTNLLYSGEQTDGATGLQPLGARRYDPRTGRFLTADTVDDPASLHKYLYVGADPINHIDPTGHVEFTLTGLLVTASIQGLIGAITGGGIDYAFHRDFGHALHQAEIWGSISFLTAGAAYGLLWWLSSADAVAQLATQITANGLKAASLQTAGMEAAEAGIAGASTIVRLSKVGYIFTRAGAPEAWSTLGYAARDLTEVAQSVAQAGEAAPQVVEAVQAGRLGTKVTVEITIASRITEGVSGKLETIWQVGQSQVNGTTKVVANLITGWLKV
jgi:RHS repeat-associated protein